MIVSVVWVGVVVAVGTDTTDVFVDEVADGDAVAAASDIGAIGWQAVIRMMVAHQNNRVLFIDFYFAPFLTQARCVQRPAGALFNWIDRR